MFFDNENNSQLFTLPETNSSPLKMDGWNTSLSYWVSAYFQGQTVSFKEGNFTAKKPSKKKHHSENQIFMMTGIS